MYLIIDIGNTLQKAGVYSEDGELLQLLRQPQLSMEQLQQWLKEYAIRYSIFSTVGASNDSLLSFLQKETKCIVFDHTTPLPVHIDYQTPSTLGKDRIAAAVAASSLFPHQNVLIVQAGTCIVMDFIDKNCHYHGGSIAPGIQMKIKSLHQFTQHLPEIEIQKTDSFIGKNTTESILNGVLLGTVDEINGAIGRYASSFENIKVILTGGDTELLQEKIKSPIFATPNLVLYGLYKILRINA